MRRRHELTDEQWACIRDHLPGKAGDPGRTAADNRLFINAVLYVLKTGIPWDDLPPRFGKPIAGVIVGKALYEGKLTIEDALREVEGPGA